MIDALFKKKEDVNMIEVKRAEIDSDDYKAINALKFYQKADMAEIIDNVCHSGNVIFYVAFYDEIICGYAMAEMTSHNVCQLMSMSVDPKYREKNIGKSILDEVIKNLNPKAVVAQVHEDSINFFTKYGFYSTDIGLSVNDLTMYHVIYRSEI